MRMITFADSPGVLVTFLSTGPQLKEIVLLKTEQTISIHVDHLKDVGQHLPVAQREQHREMSRRAVQICFSIMHPSIHSTAVESGGTRPSSQMCFKSQTQLCLLPGWKPDDIETLDIKTASKLLIFFEQTFYSPDGGMKQANAYTHAHTHTHLSSVVRSSSPVSVL